MDGLKLIYYLEKFKNYFFVRAVFIRMKSHKISVNCIY